MNENVRHLFPVTKEYVYLNAAANAPLPWTSVKEVNSMLQDVMYNGSINFMHWLRRKEQARELAAELLGVKAEQIAFMRNTSDGISALANGISWRAGDNIVSFEKEFPSNFYPWRRIRDTHGVELRLCPERDSRIDLDELIAMIDANTRVVAISAVQYASGFNADLRRIGEAVRKTGALFVVDIIQAFGAKTLDLEFVDAAAGSSHKFLCSPEGCGVMYLSGRARELIQPTVVGWASVEGWDDFANTDNPWRQGALAWESGTGASALFYGMANSLELLRSVGIANIEAYLTELTDYLCERMQSKNYELASSRAPGEKSQIVCFKHRGGLSAEELYRLLKGKKIVTAARENRLRISPHLYNNTEDIDRLVEALP